MRAGVLRYPSGEQIRVGDRVLYTGIPAEIESIEPEHVVIFAVSLDAVTFFDIDETDESDLQFIGRARANLLAINRLNH
jgi:hypothetical protein